MDEQFGKLLIRLRELIQSTILLIRLNVEIVLLKLYFTIIA